MGYRATPIYERFNSKYVVAPSGCWEWTDALDHYGYGRLQVNKKAAKAHRIAYEIFIGEIPSDKIICHHCDNRKCVNPKHIYAGTFTSNNRDMVLRGRRRNGGRPNYGEKNGNSKLKVKQVLKIKEHIKNKIPYLRIAKLFNVSPCTIRHIAIGKRWVGV